MTANYEIPMAGCIEVQWNLGVEENGDIQGYVDVVQNGVSKSRSIVMFTQNITSFNDAEMEQAALLTLVMLWRDDLKPLLFDQMWKAFIEQRERCGGYMPKEVESPEED